MLFHGPQLEERVPTDVSSWSWIISQIGSNGKFSKGRQDEAGFRDAQTGEYLAFSAIESLATYLSTAVAEKFGIKASSHVTIFCSNSIWYPVINLSKMRLGAIVTASSPEYGVEEMSYILKTSEAELVYADADSWDTVCKAVDDYGLSRDRIIFVGKTNEPNPDKGRGSTTLHDLIRQAQKKGESGQVAAWKPARGESNKDATAYLSFTSGTTSLPKGVMISHHNVIAQVMQVRQWTASDRPSVMLGVLPFYHITGIVQILQVPFAVNQEVVVMAKFKLQEMLDVIEKFRCDELWLVPPLLIRLVNDPVAAAYSLNNVKQFNTGAAPLAKEIIDKLANRFSHVRIRQAWGMTESCSALTLTPPGLQTYDNAHAVGKIVPGTTIKIIAPGRKDDEGEKALGPGETGEVLARGPQVTQGYYKRPEATAETYDKDGFLHTGDIGSMSEDGFLVIQDRLKEMIKVKGVGVAPAELEDLLLGHPLITDAAVIGIVDDYAGEVPKAFVVLANPKQDGSQPETTKKLIEDFVKSKKSRPKWLAGGIEFVDAVPKSASGKVLRKVLREQERKRRQSSKL